VVNVDWSMAGKQDKALPFFASLEDASYTHCLVGPGFQVPNSSLKDGGCFYPAFTSSFFIWGCSF